MTSPIDSTVVFETQEVRGNKTVVSRETHYGRDRFDIRRYVRSFETGGWEARTGFWMTPETFAEFVAGCAAALQTSKEGR